MDNLQSGQCILIQIDEDLVYCEIISYGPYECIVSLSRNLFGDKTVKRFPPTQRLPTEVILENMVNIEEYSV